MYSETFARGGVSGVLQVRPLTVSDLDACIKVEHAAFPPSERFSPEAGKYRLQEFPEICLGLFIDATNTGDFTKLIGHVIATRETQDRVTEESMAVPNDWTSDQNRKTSSDSDRGSTVAVHSLAIDPEFQGKRLGPVLMREYTRYLRDHVEYARRIAILAHGPLVRFYEKLGFENHGKSACQFADGGWYDMTLPIWGAG